MCKTVCLIIALCTCPATTIWAIDTCPRSTKIDCCSTYPVPPRPQPAQYWAKVDKEELSLSERAVLESQRMAAWRNSPEGQNAISTARAHASAIGDNPPGYSYRPLPANFIERDARAYELYQISGAAIKAYGRTSMVKRQQLEYTLDNDQVNRRMAVSAILAGKNPLPYTLYVPGASPSTTDRTLYNQMRLYR